MNNDVSTHTSLRNAHDNRFTEELIIPHNKKHQKQKLSHAREIRFLLSLDAEASRSLHARRFEITPPGRRDCPFHHPPQFFLVKSY